MKDFISDIEEQFRKREEEIARKERELELKEENAKLRITLHKERAENSIFLKEKDGILKELKFLYMAKAALGEIKREAAYARSEKEKGELEIKLVTLQERLLIEGEKRKVDVDINNKLHEIQKERLHQEIDNLKFEKRQMAQFHIEEIKRLLNEIDRTRAVAGEEIKRLNYTKAIVAKMHKEELDRLKHIGDLDRHYFQDKMDRMRDQVKQIKTRSDLDNDLYNKEMRRAHEQNQLLSQKMKGKF